MQRTPAIAAILFACSSLAAAQPPSMELVKAQAELERLRGLVQMGAVAPVKLAEAEEAMGDAQDDQVLRETLYGSITAQDLSEEQSQAMISAAQRRFDRQKSKIDRLSKLVDSGVLARNELEPHQMELQSRRLTVELANTRARLLEEIAAMAASEKEVMQAAGSAPQDNRIMVRFDGDGSFTPSDLRAIVTAFQNRFRKPLPISANGATRVHLAMGFDHRGRVDVAVNPDTEEGRWLRAYLEREDIPFYAFRAALRGKATGPHIHIGPGSTRIRIAD